MFSVGGAEYRKCGAKSTVANQKPACRFVGPEYLAVRPMPKTTTSSESILAKEAIGFSLIIALSWLTEFLHIPYLLFSEPHEINWRRAVIRTVVIVAVWLWVHLATKRVLKRLHHLEEYLLICSWCRKVGSEGRWLSMEEYFGSKFSTETSHGICPECAERLQRPKIPDLPTEKP